VRQPVHPEPRGWSNDLNTEATFSSLGLADTLLRALDDAGYTRPTPIQAKAIPVVLTGRDLLAAAQTGTGKTAGFTLPILQRLLEKPAQGRKPGRPRCLILTPTRELTAQVAESVEAYARYTRIRSVLIFGGVSINPQIQALRQPVDILVATPGRLLDHVQQGTVDLSGIEIFVLDEADRMLDMGFIHDIRRVIAKLPAKRQNLLFSATFSPEIRSLAHGLLDSPAEVDVAPRNTASELVDQSAHLVPRTRKRALLSYLIGSRRWTQVLVFTRTKHGANRLAEQLGKDGIEAMAIHGNKSQGARTRALSRFKDGSLGARTALMRRPYADDPCNCGVEALSDEKQEGLCRAAAARGMQVITHVIGDAAVEKTVGGAAAALIGALQYGSGIVSSLLLAAFSDGTQRAMTGLIALFVGLSALMAMGGRRVVV